MIIAVISANGGNDGRVDDAWILEFIALNMSHGFIVSLVGVHLGVREHEPRNPPAWVREVMFSRICA